MKILVTGGAGYIGNVLIRRLILEKKVKKITLLDNFFYKQEQTILDVISEKKLDVIKGDVRNKNFFKNIIKKHDIIIPLAAIVGAPACDKHKKLAKELNLDQIKFICDLKDRNQILILPVTNSGYGIGKKNKFYDENSPLNPISLYGRTKVASERYILDSNNFISLRLATVFGISPRMRVDLLVNDFVYKSYKFKKLILFESHFRRNFIHIKDIAEVIIFLLNNFKKTKNNIYNVGLEDANLTKKQLALKIKKKIPKLSIIENEFTKDPDQRNYLVSNKKIYNTGWKPKFSIDDGIDELVKYYSFNKKNYHKNI